jgi:hypothetical protein
MPRLSPSNECPKCRGRMRRAPSLFGTLYTCDRCDGDDPIEDGRRWIDGELGATQPPGPAE